MSLLTDKELDLLGRKPKALTAEDALRELLACISEINFEHGNKVTSTIKDLNQFQKAVENARRIVEQK